MRHRAHHLIIFFAPPRSFFFFVPAAALIIFFTPSWSSYSLRLSRDHPHSPIARVRVNLLCHVQRALILPLTFTSFSLLAAKVALVVAPSRSVDCRVFEVAPNSFLRRRGRAIPLLSRHCRDISFKPRRRGRALRFNSCHEVTRSVSSRSIEVARSVSSHSIEVARSVSSCAVKGAHSIYCSNAVEVANSIAPPASAPIFASHRCALSFMRRRGAQTPF